MDQGYPNPILLYESMVIFGGPPGVGQPIPGNSWYSHFRSHSLIGPAVSEEKLWHMHVTYGASLRNLFAPAHTVYTYDENVTSEIKRLSAKKLRRLLLSADDSTDNSHYLMPTGPMPSDRTAPERKVISQYVLEECCKRILKDDVEQLRRLHEVLHNDQSTAASAGMIFKYRTHQYLREGRVLDLSSLHVNTSPGVGNCIPNDRTEQLALPRMEEHLIEGGTVRTYGLHTYFRLRSAVPPAVDSWILTWPSLEGPPTLIAFQVSSSVENHDVKTISLDQVYMLGPVGARRCLVILTPKGVKPQVTALTTPLMEEFLGSCGVNEGFRILHCQIDPVELFRQEKTKATPLAQ